MRRLFIASKIELSPEFQNLRSQLQFELRHDDIVWVKDNVQHLTLRFLGGTPEQKIPEIKEALKQVCQESSSFYLELDKLGVFGSRYAPDVLWLGFDEFYFYKQLFEKMEGKLADLGFEAAYGNFVPHITLGRIKRIIDKQKFWKIIESHKPNFSQAISIRELTLYQSILTNDGPIYKVLAKENLT